jgi:predicted nucleic-acid-binding Zn-ribbon protein
MAQARQQNAPYQVPPQPQYQQYQQPTPTNANGYTTQTYPQQQLPAVQQMPQQPQPPPQVTMENLFDAMKFWKGGPAAKTDPDPCPNCGSGQYFSRAIGRRGPPPAPHCYNCGYNEGMFTQGEATTWGMTG